MKVKIQQRSVYHKFASVEIDVPDNLNSAQLIEYLWDNEHLYVDEMDEAISKATYEYGFGTSDDANDHNKSYMNEPESESEWRFDCDKLEIGGHL